MTPGPPDGARGIRKGAAGKPAALALFEDRPPRQMGGVPWNRRERGNGKAGAEGVWGDRPPRRRRGVPPGTSQISWFW